MRYAVLYVMDGQRLFDAAITCNQQAWGARPETPLQVLPGEP
jgi:predicted alpha/beta superfamily hydrolase